MTGSRAWTRNPSRDLPDESKKDKELARSNVDIRRKEDKVCGYAAGALPSRHFKGFRKSLVSRWVEGFPIKCVVMRCKGLHYPVSLALKPLSSSPRKRLMNEYLKHPERS